MSELTHIDEQGKVKMVDTSSKSITARRAVASARVLMSPETVASVKAHQTPKGDPLEAARLAGNIGAQRTAHLISPFPPFSITHRNAKNKNQGRRGLF